MDVKNPLDTTSVTDGAEAAKSEGASVFEIWKKYEDVAIHFNDLILKIRIQALGGVAALAAIAGIILKESQSGEFRWYMLGFSFLALIPIWIAVWILDFQYYTPLLHGAVLGLRSIEEKSKEHVTCKEINFSTTIDDLLQGKLKIEKNRHSLKGPKRFYSVVLITLIVMCGFAMIAGYRGQQSPKLVSTQSGNESPAAKNAATDTAK